MRHYNSGVGSKPTDAGLRYRIHNNTRVFYTSLGAYMTHAGHNAVIMTQTKLIIMKCNHSALGVGIKWSAMRRAVSFQTTRGAERSALSLCDEAHESSVLRMY